MNAVVLISVQEYQCFMQTNEHWFQADGSCKDVICSLLKKTFYGIKKKSFVRDLE